jgi:hypothetical protein
MQLLVLPIDLCQSIEHSYIINKTNEANQVVKHATGMASYAYLTVPDFASYSYYYRIVQPYIYIKPNQRSSRKLRDTLSQPSCSS